MVYELVPGRDFESTVSVSVLRKEKCFSSYRLVWGFSSSRLFRKILSLKLNQLPEQSHIHCKLNFDCPKGAFSVKQ